MLLQNKSEEVGTKLEKVIFVVVDLLKILIDQLCYTFVLNISQPKHI